jgi:phosphoribosyl 1,2-cyclic phosphodiesterase
MPLKICVLGSGSGGNCTAIWTNKEAILLDCGGFSLEYIEFNLNKLKINPNNIKGIVISHGHGDHVNNTTFKLSQKYEIPIYIHNKTFQIIEKRYKDKLDKLSIKSHFRFHPDTQFRVDSFNIIPFEIYHDDNYGDNKYVGKPFGFCVHLNHNKNLRKIGYLTDTRIVNSGILNALYDIHACILESNHDYELIQEQGPIHPGWKQHLSNEKAGDIISWISRNSNIDSKLKVFLAHVSRSHNTPKKPFIKINQILKKNNIRNVQLLPTFQYQKSKVLNIA